MHIPIAETQKIEILTFADAVIAQQQRETFNKDKWIYVPDGYLEYRYILGTIGNSPLITVGVNPSTAKPGELDNTLKSVERIARGNGFDSFIMFNVYAQRATRPDDMDTDLNVLLHQENLHAFRWALERGGERPCIWAAWGAVIEKREYLKRCLQDLVAAGESVGAQWYKAGPCSKQGHPHHPLYLKKDSLLEKFDIRSYCSNL